MDSFWELKVANELDKYGIKWIRPRSFLISNGRRYTPDFYLIDYQIFIDPKAVRKDQKQSLQIEKIKMFEEEYNTMVLILTKKKQLTWDYISVLIVTHQTADVPGGPDVKAGTSE